MAMDKIIAATGLTGGIGSQLTVQTDQFTWVNYSRSQGWNLQYPQQIVRAIPKNAGAFLNLAHWGLAQISLYDQIKKLRPDLPVVTVISDITEWTREECPEDLREYRNQKIAIKRYLELNQRPIDRMVSFGYVSTAKILNKYQGQNIAMISPAEASEKILARLFEVYNSAVLGIA